MVGAVLFVWLISWLICGAIGYAIGQAKGRGGDGVALGLVLGVVGIIIIAVMRPTPEYQARENVMVADAQARLYGVTPRPPAHGEAFGPVSAGAGTADLTAQLAQLAHLHRSGVLSEVEFSAAKRRLLHDPDEPS